MGSVESKKRFFVRHLESEPMARLCRMLRIGRMTGYRWLARYRKSGLEGLLEEDSGGRPSKSLSAETRNAVLALRSKYGWNEKRIRSEIGNVSFHAVRQVLAEARLLGIAPPRRRRSFRSFERPLPNHLWQADFSFLDDNTWLFALLDDYSRYLVDAMEFEEASTENALFVVRRAVRRHGLPYQLMTDHGAQFWNNNRKQPNAFGEIIGT